MADKHPDKAIKNHLPLKLYRRQFLKGVGLVAIGAGTALTDGFLRHPDRLDAREPQKVEATPGLKQTRNSITDIWGQRKPFSSKWSTRVDARTVAEPERWVQSACVLCAYGCGIDIGVKDGKIVGVRGRLADSVNRGRLGPKGLHGWEANHSSDRLTTPLLRRNGQLQPATWDEAMNLVVHRSQEILDKYTSEAIGFYSSGQLFLEDYYTLGVIGKAGLGTPNMDANTRLCTATAAALRESFKLSRVS